MPVGGSPLVTDVAIPGGQTIEWITAELRRVTPDSIPSVVIDVGLAIIILIVGWYLSKVAVRIVGRTVARRIERPSVVRTILRGIRLGVLTLSFVLVGIIFGLGGVEILLSVTVISAIVGVILAPLIGSLINGLFILTDQPFEIGDMIEIPDGDHVGFVEDITIRYTKIFTLENTFLVIPNAEIHTRDVINYSAEDERTRISMDFDVTYESDVPAAREVAERAARTVDSVISGGPDIRIGGARYGAAPRCDILEYGEDGVRLRLRFWVKRPYKLTIARSAVNEALADGLVEADVEFAYPRRHHVFDDTSGVAQVRVRDESPSVEDVPSTTDRDA